MEGRIEIRKCRGGREIVGTIGNRLVFRLEECVGEWEVTSATLPDGSIEKSRLICLLSLECHKVVARYRAGLVDVGYEMKV